jgi:hypothetical protein
MVDFQQKPIATKKAALKYGQTDGMKTSINFRLNGIWCTVQNSNSVGSIRLMPVSVFE